MSEFAEVKPSAVAPVSVEYVSAVMPQSAVPEFQPEPETVLASAGRESYSEPVSYGAATRLGGLRTLMTSLGIKHLHKEAELRKTHGDGERLAESTVERSSERPVERAVFAQPDKPTESGNERVDAPVKEVIAQPEIIPPLAAHEAADSEPAPTRPAKSPRVSRWDVLDDVETLPSKRGQYRKRK
jgi:hypothetical protein